MADDASSRGRPEAEAIIQPLQRLDQAALDEVSRVTTAHYDQAAAAFWRGTRDHDVSQNIEALLGALNAAEPLDILDLGCGPGRDLMAFSARGHRPIGLDGAERFVAMAQQHAGVEVWHQDLLALDLPATRFDGVFANAVLFHVPSQELSRVLAELHSTLRPGGALFTSNPRGADLERWQGDRYGCYLCWESWLAYLTAAGFELIHHYYRPPGRPRAQQPWLASVWRKPA